MNTLSSVSKKSGAIQEQPSAAIRMTTGNGHPVVLLLSLETM
jgi:hypothetical protein